MPRKRDTGFIENGSVRACERPGRWATLNGTVAQRLVWGGDTYFD